VQVRILLYEYEMNTYTINNNNNEKLSDQPFDGYNLMSKCVIFSKYWGDKYYDRRMEKNGLELVWASRRG
jgi:hypothetical protein